jgi:hypothetical protein
MRRFDKKKNMEKANILAEQRYLESKGLIKESFHEPDGTPIGVNHKHEPINEADRINMAEFFGDTTSSVETLLKMFSKYQPNNSWFMTVGYVNNASLGVTIKNENMPELEDIAKRLDNPAFTDMIGSEEWVSARDAGKNFKSPFAARKVKGEVIPSKVYATKSFTIQWGNMNQKAEKDAEVKKVYDKHGIEWQDGGEIDTKDKRGQGWDQIPGTPFQQHQNTGTQRLAIHGKKEGIKNAPTKYFLNFQGDVTELTPDEVNYVFSLSPKSYNAKMPKRLLDMENQEAAKEIHALEQAYQFRALDLSKISYIRCAMNVDGENKKFSYFNKNVVPAGLNPGEFEEFINPNPTSITAS